MEKRLQFLKYILDESMESMLSKVYHEQKTESRKGDFFNMVSKDMLEVNIIMTDIEIRNISKGNWKRLCKERTKNKAFLDLIKENSDKEKTKHINFESLEMSEYLKENKKNSLSKIIFLLRSGTLDIKSWNSWKYDDNLFVMCDLKEENITHFLECSQYGNSKLKLMKYLAGTQKTSFQLLKK
jgi:hypothetical protein